MEKEAAAAVTADGVGGAKGAGGGGGGGSGGSGDGGDGANENARAALPWRSLERWACVLGKGDLLFVPAGCAHAVSNLSATAAISANFVTASNVRLAADELSVAGLHEPAASALASHLRARGGKRDEAAASAADKDEELAAAGVDVPWAAFKRVRSFN